MVAFLISKETEVSKLERIRCEDHRNLGENGYGASLSLIHIYEYQADCDGEWGEISVDFENGTAEIIRLADWDTIKTNWFANEAIRYILSLSPDALKKYMLVPLEPPLIS